VLLKLTLALLFIAGCSMSQPATGSSASYNVNIIFTPVAPGPTGFSAQLDGKTYSSAGVSTVNVTTGTHQITGTFTGSGFVVGFATIEAAGGVKSGTVLSVSGPSPTVSGCAVTYASADTPAAQHAFQVGFTVDSQSSGALCAGPVP